MEQMSEAMTEILQLWRKFAMFQRVKKVGGELHEAEQKARAQKARDRKQKLRAMTREGRT